MLRLCGVPTPEGVNLELDHSLTVYLMKK